MGIGGRKSAGNCQKLFSADIVTKESEDLFLVSLKCGRGR